MTAARQILDFSLLSDGCLTSPVVVFLTLPGSGEKGSPPPKSSGFINDGRGYFGGRGIARLPSSSHCRGGLLPRLRDFGGGRIGTFSLPPHNAGEYFGGGGTGLPPHNVREYFGGGTGPSPHNVGVYLGGGMTGLPPRTVGVYLMPMAEENDELNILRPQT